VTEPAAAQPATTSRIRAIMSAVTRTGPWQVPPRLDVRVFWGHAQLDLREAIVEAETTISVHVTMGNLEVFVPPNMWVEVEVATVAGNITEARRRRGDRTGPRVRIVGAVKMGNCEVLALRPGESPTSSERGAHRHHHHHHHPLHRHHPYRDAVTPQPDEPPPADPGCTSARELWARDRHDASRWQAWWLLARMRRRIFLALAIVFTAGALIGWRLSSTPRWWWIAIAALLLFIHAGALAWRLTRPLIATIQAARDIGDGKLDTRIDPRQHGGEVRLLATAINDMAEKIEKQLEDQRQLLAAVSHELRTPLGHMRVLIETARDQGNGKALAELEKEVLVLDDLVGRLLASSRLEFGTLERRPLDLGELVTDLATSAGVEPDAIEATGDVRAAIDPTLVHRAIANLLDNARVHGGGAVAVRIERRAHLVAVEVDDAGPGVPPDRRADAFRAFVPSTGGGLGLGLALVSRIAVAHGGGAWIEDRPGGGARVGFSVDAS